MVYTELLNFGGDEIYFAHEPTLVGKTYGEALLAYETSAVMGIKKRNGTILLNPSMDTVIEADDQLFALAADDDAFSVSGLTAVLIDKAAICLPKPVNSAKPEKCLILGWNRCATTIIRELDHYVPAGSEVLLVADPTVSVEASQAKQILRRDCAQLRHQKINLRTGDTTDRSLLETLNVPDFDPNFLLRSRPNHCVGRGVSHCAQTTPCLWFVDVQGHKFAPLSGTATGGMGQPMIAVFDTNIVIDTLNGVDEADIEYNRYKRVMISLITWMEGNNLPSQAVLRFAEKTVHE